MTEKKIVFVGKRGFSSTLKDIPVLLNQARQEGYAAAIADATKLVEEFCISCTDDSGVCGACVSCLYSRQIKALLSRGSR